MAELKLRERSKLSLREQLQDRLIQERVGEQEATQKAGLAVGARFPEITTETFDVVKDELLRTNRSSTIDQIKAEAQRRKGIEKVQDVDAVLADPEIPLDEKQSIVQATVEEPEDVSLNEEFDLNVAIQSSAPTQTAEEIKSSMLDYLTFRIEMPETVRRIEAEEVTYNSDNALRDVIEGIALPGYGVQLFEVLNEALPGFAGGFDAVLPGSMVERFVEHASSLAPQEQEAVIRKIAKAVERNEFYGRENGFIKRDIMLSLLGDFKPSKSREIFINVMSLLDLMALGEFVRLGGAAFKGIKNAGKMIAKGETAQRIIGNYLSRKNPHSISSRMDTLSPQESRQITKDALEGKVNPRNIGETEESLTQASVAPEPANVSPTASPSVHDPLDEVLGYDGRAIGWTEIEQLGLTNRAAVRMEALKKTAPAVHLNKVQFDPIPGGLRATTYIGKTDTGFSTFKEARSMMRKIRGEFPTEMYVKDGRTGTLKPVAEVPVKDRIKEYYLKFTDELKYSSEDAVGINPVLKDGITGELAKFATKSSVFGQWFSWATSAAGDVKAARNKALSRMLAPLTRLSGNRRALVEDVIDRGDQVGRFFTDDELLLEWAAKSEKEQRQLLEAYHGFQRFQQATWKLMNDGIRERLDAAGFKEVILPRLASDRVTMGRRVDTGPQLNDSVYDPVTNQIRPLNAEELQKVEDGSLNFIEFKTPLNIDHVEAKWALNIGNRGDIAINQLPPNVIKNVPGRIPRLYEVTHIVKKRVESWRDGKPQEGLIPISMARDSGSAQRVADEMELAEVGSLNPNNRQYVVVPAKELREDADYANRTSLDFHEDTGSFWYSDRGLEMDGVDGLRPVMPVMDRLDLARERASRIGTLDALALKLKRNLDLEFGQEFGIDVNGVRQIPLYGDLPRNIPTTRTEKGLTERRYRDMIAARNYLKLFTGLDEGILQRGIRNTAIYLADNLATTKTNSLLDKTRTAGAQFLLRNRNFDPINKAKQAAFLAYIVGNPFRQLALQSQQASVYLTEQHALRYFASGRGVRDWNGLFVGLASRHNPAQFQWITKTMAPKLGMSEDEYIEFVDSIRKSGLLANIDSHAFSAGMLADKTAGGGRGFIKNIRDPERRELAGRARNKAYDAFNGTIRAAKLMRNMGFDAGEASHLMAAFLASRNAWIKNNPKKSALWATEGLPEIAARARQISFEMTREGALGFQKGLLGLIFQFASHNTKALQALIPRTVRGKQIPVLGKLSNEAFNNKQKAAIAASQLGTYGVGGYGVYESYEQLKAMVGEEPPEELDLLIKEGLFGSLFTALVRGAWDEPNEVSDLDVSGNLAPFSGIFKLPIFRTMADAAALGVFDIRNIPSIGVGEDVLEAIDMVSFLTGSFDPDDVDMSETERALLVLDSIARIAPVYNKLMKSRAELAINRIISNSGDERVRATGSEIMLKAILGIQPTADRQAFELSTDLGGLRAGGFREEPVNQDLRDYAKNIYENTMKILQTRGDTVAGVSEALDFVKAVARVDRETMSDFEYRFVHQQQIPQIMYSDLEEGTEDAKLIKKVESLLRNGNIETTDSIIDRVGQSEVLKNRERFAEFLRELGE